MAVQPGLCQTWSQTPKTGFLTTRLKCMGLENQGPGKTYMTQTLKSDCSIISDEAFLLVPLTSIITSITSITTSITCINTSITRINTSTTSINTNDVAQLFFPQTIFSFLFIFSPLKLSPVPKTQAGISPLNAYNS